VLLVLLGYGAHANARARVWRSAEAVDRDAIANYPEGVAGQLDRARRAVGMGDTDTAMDALEALVRLGSDNPMAYLTDPALQPLRGNPRYEALLRQIARKWLDHYEQLPNKAPGFGVIDAVLYYILVGELDKAERLIEETRRAPGAVAPQLLDQLHESVRREREALEVPG
jgi:predicted Zn-dependent protease